MNLQIFREERYSKKAKFVVAILVLIICLFFPFYSNYKLAVSGITFTVDLEVLSINSCSSKETACRFNADKLEIGDQILRIGDLSREEIAADRRLAPFGDAEPGDIVPVTIDRAGKVLSYEIQMVRPNLINIIILVFTYMLVFGPFWLVGFYLSLYLAPTDSRWRLQVAFYFYTALWIAIGTQAAYKYLFSSLIQHALSWMLVPIYIHFHLVTPASLLQKGKRKLLIPLYIIAAALAVMELFQFLPKLAYLVGILSAIICSIIILAYRAIAKREQAEKITARIMISGVIIAFGPGILLWVIPKLVEARMPGSFATIVIFLALPILPLSYGYGIYKRWLGQIESRLNRFLSRYSLFTLYLIFFSIISLLASSRQLNLTSPDIMYSTIILSAFLLAALPLKELTDKFMSQLAYGTHYQKSDIVHRYAGLILASNSSLELANLINGDLCKTLSINQSALVAIKNDKIFPIYYQGLDIISLQISEDAIRRIFEAREVYVSPGGADFPDIQSNFPWLRLVIPLIGKSRLIGLWLLGSRDPDDYYTQNDIELLVDISRQIASTIETRQLFAALQEQLNERRKAETQIALYAERLTLLRQLDQSMLAETTPEDIALAALRKLVEIVACTRTSVIYLHDVKVSLLALHDTRGLDDPTALPDLTPKMLSSLDQGNIWLLEDPSNIDANLPLAKYLDSLGLATALVAPMKLDGHLLGALSISYDRPTEIKQEWKEIAREIANSLVLAVHNARLRDTITQHSHDLKQLSLRLITIQENERKRISYELHDEIGQILTAIKFDLVAIEQETGSYKDSTINNRLSDAKELVEELMEQVRSMSLDLRPSMLQDLGLASTIRWYANTYAERRDMDVQFEIPDLSQRFKEEVEIALYRVYQEALSNVSRHAQANSIKLYLNQQDHKIVGYIEDDGKGFDVDELGVRKPADIGVGLIAMRERISALNGIFRLRSEIGKGTRVYFEVPLGEVE